MAVEVTDRDAVSINPHWEDSRLRRIKAWIVWWFQNLQTSHHRVMMRYLRKRGWVVFYLDKRARECSADICWLALYEQQEGVE